MNKRHIQNADSNILAKVKSNTRMQDWKEKPPRIGNMEKNNREVKAANLGSTDKGKICSGSKSNSGGYSKNLEKEICAGN